MYMFTGRKCLRKRNNLGRIALCVTDCVSPIIDRFVCIQYHVILSSEDKRVELILGS